MDVSVLIGKPLGARRPSPPITAREQGNTHTHTQTHVMRVGGPRVRPAAGESDHRYRYQPSVLSENDSNRPVIGPMGITVPPLRAPPCPTWPPEASVTLTKPN